MIEKDTITKIVHHFGSYPQMSKAVEELVELAEVLIKAVNKPNKFDKDALIEELADVEIMLEQMKYIFNIDSVDLSYEKDMKIQRTLERIEEDAAYIGDCETCRYTDLPTDSERCTSCNHHTGTRNMYEPYVPDCPYLPDCPWK